MELEARLQENLLKSRIEASKDFSTVYFGSIGRSPKDTPLPSWWEDKIESCDPDKCTPYAVSLDGRFRPDERLTPDEAIEYLTIGRNYLHAKAAQYQYACSSYPTSTGDCQHGAQARGMIGRVDRVIRIIKQSQVNYLQKQQQEKRNQQLQLEKIEADRMKTQLFEKEKQELIVKEKEEKAWIAKRNKTLLLIGSLFLFG